MLSWQSLSLSSQLETAQSCRAAALKSAVCCRCHMLPCGRPHQTGLQGKDDLYFTKLARSLVRWHLSFRCSLVPPASQQVRSPLSGVHPQWWPPGLRTLSSRRYLVTICHMVTVHYRYNTVHCTTAITTTVSTLLEMECNIISIIQYNRWNCWLTLQQM